MSEKICITGCGLVTALGDNLSENWQNIISGKSAINKKENGVPVAFSDTKNTPEDILPEMLNKSIQQALNQANLNSGVKKNFSFGLILAIGKPNFFSLKTAPLNFSVLDFWNQNLSEKVKSNLPFNCKIFTNSVSACSSGLSAVYLAKQWLKDNLVDIVICAAGESPRHQLIRESFSRLNLLTKDTVRPFSRYRSGFALGEGAGTIVLEKENTACQRQVKILARLEKISLSNASHNPINYGSDWRPLAKLLQATIIDNGKIIIPDYIKAHGTATVINDILESKAIIETFGEKISRTISISSLKAAFGHTLSASGMIELIITIMAKRNNVIPPTLNWLGRDENCPLDYTPNQPRERKINYALAISLGFGGQMAIALIS